MSSFDVDLSDEDALAKALADMDASDSEHGGEDEEEDSEDKEAAMNFVVDYYARQAQKEARAEGKTWNPHTMVPSMDVDLIEMLPVAFDALATALTQQRNLLARNARAGRGVHLSLKQDDLLNPDAAMRVLAKEAPEEAAELLAGRVMAALGDGGAGRHDAAARALTALLSACSPPPLHANKVLRASVPWLQFVDLVPGSPDAEAGRTVISGAGGGTVEDYVRAGGCIPMVGGEPYRVLAVLPGEQGPSASRLLCALPPLTVKGFTMCDTPPEVLSLLSRHVREKRHAAAAAAPLDDAAAAAAAGLEDTAVRSAARPSGPIYDGLAAEKTARELLSSPPMATYSPVSQGDHAAILNLLKPLVEKWAGVPCVATSFYGVREYKRGAVLCMHADKNPLTRAVGVSITVAVDPNAATPWALVMGHDTDVVLPVGKMAIYEACRVKHGRPEPLDGEFFVNCYAHFVPCEWGPVVAQGRIEQIVEDA